MIWCRKSVGNILVYWFEIPMTIITNRSIMINVLIIMEFVLWIIRTEIDIERERKTRNRLMNCRCNGDDDDSITSFWFGFRSFQVWLANCTLFFSEIFLFPLDLLSEIDWNGWNTLNTMTQTKQNETLCLHLWKKKLLCPF